MRFSVYSESENVQEAALITKYLHVCFDNKGLVFVEGDYTGMGCERKSFHIIRETEDIWHLVTDYSMMFEKSNTAILT